MSADKCSHQFPHCGFSKKLKVWVCGRCGLPTECQHPRQEFSIDNSCGGFFYTCKDCHEIVDGGMVGHN